MITGPEWIRAAFSITRVVQVMFGGQPTTVSSPSNDFYDVTVQLDVERIERTKYSRCLEGRIESLIGTDPSTNLPSPSRTSLCTTKELSVFSGSH
jgi:hypothetical protein